MSAVRRLACAAALAAALLPCRAQTWNGGSVTTSNWSDSGNWSGGAAPASSTTTDVVLGGTTRLSSSVDSPFTLKTLTFASGAGAFTLGGSEISIAGVNNTTPSISNLSGQSQTVANSIKLLGATEFLDTSGDLHLNAINLNGNAVLFTAAAGQTTYLDGVLSGTSTIVEFAGGTFVLSKTATYNITSRIRYGTVVVDASGAFGTTSSVIMGISSAGNHAVSLLTGAAVTVDRGITLTYASGDTYTIGGQSADVSTYSGKITLNDTTANNVASTFTAAAGGRVNFTNNLTVSTGTGVGSITKIGAGIVALSGAANDYLGTTAVSAGTLLVNGTLAPGGGAVTVQSGATFGGSGTVNRAVAVQNGGILSAGDVAANGTSLGGVFTLGSGLLLSGTSIAAFDLAAAGAAGDDKIAVTGAFTLDGLLQVTGLSGFGAGTYALFTYTGGTFTDNGLDVGTMPSGFTYQISMATPGEVDLVVSAVPESGVLSLCGGALFLLPLLRRRAARLRT